MNIHFCVSCGQHNPLTVRPPNVSISPFIGSPIWTALPLLYPVLSVCHGTKTSTGTWLGPEPRKSFNRPIRAGADPCAAIKGNPSADPDPLVSHSLFCVLDALQIEHHPSNPQQPFCKWQVRERRESGNRHENNVHRVYGRDGEKEIEIKYPGWLEGAF